MATKIRIGVIRVVTTDDWDFLRKHAQLISDYIAESALDIITDRIEGFPNGIPNEKEEERAIPHVIETGERVADEHELDSLFISCAADPGVSELQKKLKIPVVGAGSASAYIAKSFGLPIGILGIDEKVPRVVADALGDVAWKYRKPMDVKTTLDINHSVDEYVKLAQQQVAEDGAGVILLACTGLSTAGLAPRIHDELGIPVIDPVLSSGLVAYYAARGNQTKKRGLK